LFPTAVSILLALTLGLNVPVQLLEESPEPERFGALQREEISDLVLQDAPRQAEVQAALPESAKLTDGTQVHLRFIRAVVSSQVIAGEKVALEVVDPVLVGSLVAISQHAPAEATVTVSQARRSMGGGGNLALKVESICLADGEIASLRAIKDVKGGDTQPRLLAGLGTAGMMYWAASPLILLFYVKGKSANIPAGTEITAYIAGDFTLDPSKFHAVGASPQEKIAPK
jgi:hypothetical protein